MPVEDLYVLCQPVAEEELVQIAAWRACRLLAQPLEVVGFAEPVAIRYWLFYPSDSLIGTSDISKHGQIVYYISLNFRDSV